MTKNLKPALWATFTVGAAVGIPATIHYLFGPAGTTIALAIFGVAAIWGTVFMVAR